MAGAVAAGGAGAGRMTDKKARVVFTPSGRRGAFAIGTPVLEAAQSLGVDVDTVYRYNPGYNRWATSPDGPYRVVLPLDSAEVLRAGLQRIDGSALMKWDQVVVQSGDTLSELSTRHRVPVSVLRTANNLDDDLIRVGQKLRLPRDEQLLVDPLYAQAALELQELQSGLIAADRVTHRVRRGESLSVIARRYRVSVKDLQRWNNIGDPRRLRAGTTITVFHSPAAPQPAKSGSVSSLRTSPSSMMPQWPWSV